MARVIGTLLIIGILIGGLIAGFFLLRDRVSFFQQAGNATRLAFQPATANKPVGKNIPMVLTLNNAKKIKQAKIVIEFDKTKLKLVGTPKINPDLGKAKVTKVKKANQTGRIELTAKVGKKKGGFKDAYLLKFTFRGKNETNGQSTDVKINVSESYLKTEKNENLLDASVAKTASLVIRKKGQEPEPICDELEIDPEEGLAPLTVTANVTAIPINKNTPIKQYIFDFAGTEKKTNKRTESFTFSTPGSYEIKASVKDSKNNVSEECVSAIYIFDPSDESHNVCANNACVEVEGPGNDECDSLGDSCGNPNKHKACANNACVEVAGDGNDECLELGQACGTNTHLTCVNDACVEVTGAGTSNCTTIGETCGEPNKHLACVSNSCTLIDGAGNDQCATQGATCGTGNSHFECINSSCVSVSGSGTNQCQTAGANCGSDQTHKSCINNSCTVVQGSGNDECSLAGSSCSGEPTHLSCVNNSCVIVTGSGTNECTTAGSSCGATKHKACVNNACTEVDGEAVDECTTLGAACGESTSHKACVNNTCTVVQGSGTDECQTAGASCGSTQTHKACVSNSCTVVQGSGTDECQTAGASCQTNSSSVCQTPGDPTCYDCNQDGSITILDYSCFRSNYGWRED